MVHPLGCQIRCHLQHADESCLTFQVSGPLTVAVCRCNTRHKNASCFRMTSRARLETRDSRVNRLYALELEIRNPQLGTTKSTLNSCHVSNSAKRWYMSVVPHGRPPGTTADFDFYTTPVTQSSARILPRTGWTATGSGFHPPTLEV
jgi:hypothetical protein